MRQPTSVCLRPSCTSWPHHYSRTEPGRGLVSAPPWRVGSPPPQGSSLRFELCCLEPSTLSRPHAPHSQAQHNFIALRFICTAFAVRERLGDPRAVPGFCFPFPTDMPPSTTPGSSNIHKFQSRDVDVGLRQGLSGSALPNLPQSVSRGYGISRLPGSLICYGLPVCTPPCTDLTRSPSHRGLLHLGF